MINKKLVAKSTKLFLSFALLGGFSAGLISAEITQAAELSPNIVQLLNDNQAQDSAITYTSNGKTTVLPVPVGQSIEVRGQTNKIDIKINKKTTSLKNVTDITFKGLAVSNLIPFYTNSVKNLTLDNVNFKKGIDISGTKGLQSLLVKDSTFGATDYSLAVHSAPLLTSLIVDNSLFNADLRIFTNKSLASATISNSVMKKDVKQTDNQRGYYTDFINNRFEYSKKRTISSGGMNANDIFYVNPGDLAEIGTTRFDGSAPGRINYRLADGVLQTIDVPAGAKVTKVSDLGNQITVQTSDGQTVVLNDTKSLTFYNVDITDVVAFTQKNLLLEKIEFINSRTKLIDIAYSNTIQSVKINRTEVSQASGYVSVYNNKTIKEFAMQESIVTGGSGYISVYNSPTLETFIMNNTYTYGYLSAYNLGGSVLQLSNSKYDDYINTNQVIEGEGGRVTIGEKPILERFNFDVHSIGMDFDIVNYVKAYDPEDGDISEKIEYIDKGGFNPYIPDVYTMIISVTDSDGNVTEMELDIEVDF